MPAVVASHSRRNPPPAKKAKLSSQSRPDGLSALLNATPGKKPTVTAKLNGVRNARKDKVQDATAVVSGGRAGHGDVDMQDASKEVIEISSAEESSDLDSSDNEEGDNTGAGAEKDLAAADQDQPMDDGAGESDELTFGERIQAQDAESARAPHVVDVEQAFGGDNNDSRALATAASGRTLAKNSASSLGTVLTQALRTNDQELLDSCLRVIDVETVYATVERLPSPLVGNLLQKLAERLQQKPGRAGILMVWVQWSLAAHGGYLASQPQLVKQLDALNRVLKERASGLQPLLSLKGRLDMLQAQLELRRRNQKRLADDGEEEAVIYVEGDDDAASGDDNDDGLRNSRKRLRHGSEDDDEDISSIDDMPTTQEFDEDEEASEDSDDLIDDEAEETDSDTGEEEPMSDDDLGEDVASESEEESKPARRSTIGRAGLSRRH